MPTLPTLPTLLTYLIRFKVKGKWKVMHKEGDDMETTLQEAKKDIRKEYGQNWNGSICIENPEFMVSKNEWKEATA